MAKLQILMKMNLPQSHFQQNVIYDGMAPQSSFKMVTDAQKNQ